jgi:uncharacterized protein YjbI with pentapeptide repeats
MSDVIIDGTNFLRTDLSGVDFTTTKPIGVVFLYSDLTNSNFEGVNIIPYDSYTRTFENKAYLDPKQDIESGDFSQRKLVEELFGNVLDHIRIVSTKVSGNDLDVEYFFYNNFSFANLENANFKNTGLWFSHFYSTNLTNADLSGADLSFSFLVKADLSNANLQDADLSGADLSDADLTGTNLTGTNLTDANLGGAIYDDYTIRNCIGHYICVN